MTFGTLLGGGSVNVDEGTAHHEDGVFVLEPTAAVELNVTRFMRADVGAAYRWVVGASMPGLSDSDVSAFSLVAVLKFGKF